jgi:hypothetical protein
MLAGGNSARCDMLREDMNGAVRNLIRKIHMYLGLFNLTSVIVFGITGLAVTFQRSPERAGDKTPTRFVDFAIGPAATDAEVARAIYDRLKLPLTSPVPQWAIRRDAAGRLTLDFYTVNGTHRVTVLEQAQSLQVDSVRNSLPHFFDDLHTVTAAESAADLRLRFWSWYNEIAIGSLMLMAASGVLLWLLSRPRFRAAQFAAAGGFCAVAALWYFNT